MKPRLLIVDDDPQVRRSLSNLLGREGYAITEAAGGGEAEELFARDVFDLVITDLRMEPVSGLELLRRVKRIRGDVEVIVISGAGTVEKAVEAMKLKAFDFISKPFQVDEILQRVRNALEKSRLKEEVVRLQRETRSMFGMGGIVGQSEAIRRLLRILPRIAQTDSNVLIMGESGTGKELIARAICEASPRAGGSFVSVNCAAFHEQLLEDELFGHVRGAYTGAEAARKGLFEEADGGTLFLDEIGDAPLPVQAKLLRVLEERCVRRLGENRSIPVNVRLVTATNQDLKEMIGRGRFRRDLFFRLNVIPVQVPPLRERAEDVPLLAAHFIDRYNEKAKKQIRGITREARNLLMTYSWPGNVRELENAIQRMIALSTEETLDVADLPPEIREVDRGMPRNLKQVAQVTSEIAEKSFIIEALTRTGWNVTRTAKDLGISRATLQNKMKKYDLRRHR